MNDKMEGGWAVGRATRTALVLAFLFLFASGVNANTIEVNPGQSIQDAIDNPSIGFGDAVLVNGPGIYLENVVVNKGIILRGINNPTLSNASPGANTINVTDEGAFATIAGFNITGNKLGAGVYVNCSAYNVSLVYNNIYRNSVSDSAKNGTGLDASEFTSFCSDSAPFTLDFWGEYGRGLFRGRPGASSSVNNHVYYNNGIKGKYADASSWLTAGVINGNATSTAYYTGCEDLVLRNPEAGVDVSIDGSFGDSCVVGSAEYLGTPYGPIPAGLGIPIRYVDVFVKNDNVDQAKVSISYSPDEVENAGVLEDSLTPYLWTGATWISPIRGTLIRDPDSGVVSGSFTTQSLIGQPIALIGRSYEVTILPKADPNNPISTNPVLNITLESGDTITGVYYQLDGFAGVWNPIEVPFYGSIWNNPAWSIPDSDWANLTNASHTFYFMFTTGASTTDVGGKGEISWRFTKGTEPPVSPIVVTSPRAGDTLTRTPWLITWTMPNPENVAEVDLYFARDGDFSNRGGLNNPLPIAKLGADTSYLWTSPNFQTDAAKIAVVVNYVGNTQLVGFSDDFSLAKGYSFHAYKSTPKTPWQLGSGISRAVAIIGSWFKKPHIPYVIG